MLAQAAHTRSSPIAVVVVGRGGAPNLLSPPVDIVWRAGAGPYEAGPDSSKVTFANDAICSGLRSPFSVWRFEPKLQVSRTAGAHRDHRDYDRMDSQMHKCMPRLQLARWHGNIAPIV